jgi:hypothetical protein
MLEAVVGGAVATALDFVSSAITTAAGTQPVNDWLSGCKNRLIAGRFQPGNHDLVRGIRTAHLCAIDVVRRRHATIIRQLAASEVDADEQTFAADVQSFLSSRLKIVSSSGVDFNVLRVEDIDHVLTELVHPGTTEGLAAQAAKIRKDAVAHALEEIEKDSNLLAPPLFRRAFEGDIGPGWYNAFALYVTEELKTNERFRSIFLVGELVDIRHALASLNAQIQDLHERFPDLRDFRAFEERLGEIRDQIATTPEKVVAILQQQGYVRKADAAAEGSERAEDGFSEQAARLVVKSIAKSKTLRSVYQFDENAYVDDEGSQVKNIPYALFEKWWLAFPTGFLCAFLDNQIIAVIGLFPVTEQWARDFLARKTSEFELSEAVIRKSSRKFWYFSGISSNVKGAGLQTHLPNILGFGILEWARFNLKSIGKKPVMIVSEGTSPVGEHLLHDLFRFDLQNAATLAGEYPRFSKETDLTKIKRLLLEHRYFSKCALLHQAVAAELAEIPSSQ